MQAYHWAALFPDAVDRARGELRGGAHPVHNQVFLRGLMAVLEAAGDIGGGRFAAEPDAAKRALGRIYAGWALSQDFYRAGRHLASGPVPNLGAPIWRLFCGRIGRRGLVRGRRRIYMLNCGPGMRRISVRMRYMAAICRRRCGRSGRVCC